MGIIAGIAKIVGALGIRIIVAVIAAHRGRRIAVGIHIGADAGQIVVEERLGVGRVGLHRIGRRDAEHGRILVRFDLVGIVEKQGQLARAVIMDEFGVGLPATLLPVEIPSPRALAGHAQIGRIVATEGAGIEPDIAARGGVGPYSLVQQQAAFGRGVGREGFNRAAQIVGRRSAEIARAGGDDHAADVLRDHRPLRRKSVVVAVVLVAQRDPVHRVAELLEIEAVDEDLGILLVGPPRIGCDVEHAGQGLHCLQRRNTRQDLLDFALRDGRGGTGRLGGDDNGALLVAIGRRRLLRGHGRWGGKGHQRDTRSKREPQRNDVFHIDSPLYYGSDGQHASLSIAAERVSAVAKRRQKYEFERSPNRSAEEARPGWKPIAGDHLRSGLGGRKRRPRAPRPSFRRRIGWGDSRRVKRRFSPNLPRPAWHRVRPEAPSTA